MEKSNCNQWISGVCLALVLVSSASQAEIFKWVDANGQTHYSEKKEEADKAKALELRVKSPPTSTQENNSLMQSLQEQERQFKKRQEQQLTGNTSAAPAVTKPVSLSGGRSDGTDASRCNLARDVLSGAVRHTNGAPTDQNDIDIAKNDVSSFCH